jgi:hypothetical protein
MPMKREKATLTAIVGGVLRRLPWFSALMYAETVRLVWYPRQTKATPLLVVELPQ